MQSLFESHVHCLETTAKSRLRLTSEGLSYSYYLFDNHFGNRFLYITSELEITKDDYYFDEDTKSIKRWEKGRTIGQKVIATTDPSLDMKARPSNSFLTRYAESYPDIKKVMVEFRYDDALMDTVPKLAPDATITIRPVRK